MYLKAGGALVAIVLGAIGFATSSLADVSIDDLQGSWNNDNSGENIGINGYTVQDSRRGQARITVAADYAANFVIVYQGNIQCWYFITLTNAGRRMNVAVRNQNQDRFVCMSGP